MRTIKINKKKVKPAVVASIKTDSIGEEIGFEVGDQLISINGVRPRDLMITNFLLLKKTLN